MPQGPFLSEERIEHYRNQLVKDGIPVRFLYKGQSLYITTGDLCSKGCNVMYQKVYWSFTRETALTIATELSVTPIFSK